MTDWVATYPSRSWEQLRTGVPTQYPTLNAPALNALPLNPYQPKARKASGKPELQETSSKRLGPADPNVYLRAHLAGMHGGLDKSSSSSSRLNPHLPTFGKALPKIKNPPRDLYDRISDRYVIKKQTFVLQLRNGGKDATSQQKCVESVPRSVRIDGSRGRRRPSGHGCTKALAVAGQLRANPRGSLIGRQHVGGSSWLTIGISEATCWKGQQNAIRMTK